MTTKELRAALHAVPFRRFILRAGSGVEIEVPHPEFIAFSQGGRTISVALPDGGFAIFDLLLVEALEFPSSPRHRRSA